MKTFFLLMCVHALCDFQLQNGAMHERKMPTPRDGHNDWYIWMGAHALICGGGVYLVTGSLFLGITETIAHACIDTWKANNRIGFQEDQALHVLFRICYAIVLTPDSLCAIL